MISSDVSAFAAMLASPIGGWVVAYFLGKKIDSKDTQIQARHDAHISTLVEAGKRCDDNYQTLLGRVFQLEDKKQDKGT